MNKNAFANSTRKKSTFICCVYFVTKGNGLCHKLRYFCARSCAYMQVSGHVTKE